MHHVFRHQDRRKDKILALHVKFNIRADKLISENTKKPLQTNIIYTPMSVYLKYQRIINKYHIETKLEERIQKIFMT